MSSSNKNVRPKGRDEIRHVMPEVRLPRREPVGKVVVDDPSPNAGISRRQTVVATRTLRGDILAQMHDRGTIDEMQFLAGRRWQQLYERATIGGGSPDPARTIVDGGRIAEPFTLEVRKAIAQIVGIDAVLGKEGSRIVRHLLAEGLTMAQCTRACDNLNGFASRRQIEAMSHRFREVLATLAEEFGLRSKGPGG